MRPRPTFLFHIPRTAGTAVFDSVRLAVGAGSVLHIEDLRPQPLERRIRRHCAEGRTRFFAAHISPKALPPVPGLLRTTLVRHPVDRVISKFGSVYDLRRDLQKHFDYLVGCAGYLDARFSLADVEGWMVKYRNDDATIRFLTDQWDGPVNRRDLVSAKAALASCDIVGIHEALQTYIGTLAEAAQFNLTVLLRTNESRPEIIDEDPKIVRQRLSRYCELDLELYEYAKELAKGTAGRFPVAAGRAAGLRLAYRQKAPLRERLLGHTRLNGVEFGMRVASRLRRGRNGILEASLLLRRAIKHWPRAIYRQVRTLPLAVPTPLSGSEAQVRQESEDSIIGS